MSAACRALLYRARSDKTEPGRWALLANGRMELSPDIFLELSEGARFVADQPFSDEKRSAHRVNIAIDAMMVRLGATRTPPAPVKVNDLSARGLGLEASEPFVVNENFAIRFVRRDGSPLWIQCTVARWQPIGQSVYAVGAKFVKLLSAPKPTEAAAA